MVRGAGERSKRGEAHERLREGFLQQAATQLHELGQLLATDDGGEVRDSAAFDLGRLGDTATALGLEAVGRACTEASEDVLKRPPGDVLRRVATAIRRARGARRFGPLLVVVDGEQAERLRREADLEPEPLRLFIDLEAFAGALHTDEPTSVVLPVEATDAVAQLASSERFPVLVHGSASAWDARLAAMQAGAAGFVPHPFRLHDLAVLGRWRARVSSETLEAVLLAEAGPLRDRLQGALEAAGVATVATADPAELGVALESSPSAVILGAKVGGIAAHVLASVIRAHPHCGRIPILVSGRPEDPAALRGLGVDDVMRADADPTQAAQRLRDRVTRIERLPGGWEVLPGLRDRLATLEGLGRLLTTTSRTREPLSVALLELVGLGDAIRRFGPPALRAARLHLVQGMRSRLRRTDLFGELGEGRLLVALPGAVDTVTRRRLGALAEELEQRWQRDRLLKGVTLRLGVADTESGLGGVALRAEQDLLS